MPLPERLTLYLGHPTARLWPTALLVLFTGAIFEGSGLRIALWIVVGLVCTPLLLWSAALWFALCLLLYSLMPSLVPHIGALVVGGSLLLGVGITAQSKQTNAKGDALGPLQRWLDMGYVRVLYGLILLFVVFWALLRTTPLVEGVAWCGLIALAWHTVPAGSRPIRAYASELALIAVSLNIAIALAEVGARVLLPARQQYGPVFQPHPEYVYLLKPGARRQAKVHMGDGEYLHWEVAVSPQGLRDREIGAKQPGEFRILMLGDSYTMGHVTPENTIPSQLEAILRERRGDESVTVINAGLGGSGPLQQLGMLRERGLRLDPDLVILQTNLGNDIHDTLAVTEDSLPAYSRDRVKSLRRMRAQANREPPAQAEALLRDHSRLYRELVFQRDNDDLVGDWLSRWRVFPERARVPLPHSNERPYHLEAHLSEWYPALEDGFKRFTQELLLIQTECETNGIPFAAYCIPSKYDIDDAIWRDEVADFLRDDYTQGKACATMDAFFQEAEITHFSVTDALREARTEMEVHYEYDFHLRETGNRVVAEVAADFVAKRYSDGGAVRIAAIGAGRL